VWIAQFLGTRPPEKCVEGMFAGATACLRSADSSVVLNAAACLNCLLLAEVRQQ